MANVQIAVWIDIFIWVVIQKLPFDGARGDNFCTALWLQCLNDQRQGAIETIVDAAVIIGKFFVNMLDAVALQLLMQLPGAVHQVELVPVAAVEVEKFQVFQISVQRVH